MNSSSATHPSFDHFRYRATSYPQAAKGAGRWVAIAAVVAAHVALGWGLLQLDVVRDSLRATAPIFVSLIDGAAPPAPEPAVQKVAPVVPKSPPKPAPREKAVKPPAPVLAAEPRAQEPAAYTVPPPPAAPEQDTAPIPEPTAPSGQGVPGPSVPTTTAAEQASAGPKTIPASAVRYVQRPAPVYPRNSQRLGEEGTVIVRVLIDADGRAREAQVSESSGFARLDQSALTAVREALFQSYTENGRPMAVWVLIPISFKL